MTLVGWQLEWWVKKLAEVEPLLLGGSVGGRMRLLSSHRGLHLKKI